jgi:hypothetical protein
MESKKKKRGTKGVEEKWKRSGEEKRREEKPNVEEGRGRMRRRLKSDKGLDGSPTATTRERPIWG